MNKSDKCYPLELTQKIADKYPGCWDKIEKLRLAEKDTFDSRRCYIPISICSDVAAECQSSDIVTDTMILSVTSAWRLHKQIYQFDPEMEELLYDQYDEDLIIPIEILNNLPYQCIYIKTNFVPNSNGFFVSIEDDMKTHELELRLTILENNMKCGCIPIHLIPNGTIRDGFDKARQINDYQLSHLLGKKQSDVIIQTTKKYSEKMLEYTSKMIQLVLYVCASNKEILEDEKQKKILRQPKNHTSIKDKYREVQKWNCGTETGTIIRKMKSSNKNKKYNYISIGYTEKGSPKRPHSRKGHWHHFWTGAKNSNNRKLELRWLSPTFINAKINDIPQINLIEGNNKNDNKNN